MDDIDKLKDTIIRQAIEIAKLQKEIDSLEYWRDISLKRIEKLEKKLPDLTEVKHD